MQAGKFLIGVAVLSLAATAAGAETLTDRLQARRMTVLQVNRETSQFQCVEHKRWTSVSRADLSVVGVGDIVRVENQAAGHARLVLLRSAADELAGSER